MSDKIKVVIIDDHPLLRQGVVTILKAQRDMQVVGEGATAQDAMRLAATLQPDIVLLDISIPGGGVGAAQGVASSCPDVKIAILTASEQEDDVTAAFRAGARAYIVKGVPPRELVRILRAVHAGETYVTPNLSVDLLVRRETAGPPNPLDEITERELEILEGVVAGSSNKEIGHRLGLSEKTIKYHMTNILQKLQVRSRVEAALWFEKNKHLRRPPQLPEVDPKTP